MAIFPGEFSRGRGRIVVLSTSEAETLTSSEASSGSTLGSWIVENNVKAENEDSDVEAIDQ